MNNAFLPVPLDPEEEDNNFLSRIHDPSGDEEFVRKNTIVAIARGHAALSEAVKLAAQAQDPKAYEALSKVLDSVVAANRALVELKEKQAAAGRGADTGTVNNNLFVGSTTELLEAMKVMKTRNDE